MKIIHLESLRQPRNSLQPKFVFLSPHLPEAVKIAKEGLEVFQEILIDFHVSGIPLMMAVFESVGSRCPFFVSFLAYPYVKQIPAMPSLRQDAEMKGIGARK
jgi:hypothetical protein